MTTSTHPVGSCGGALRQATGCNCSIADATPAGAEQNLGASGYVAGGWLPEAVTESEVDSVLDEAGLDSDDFGVLGDDFEGGDLYAVTSAMADDASTTLDYVYDSTMDQVAIAAIMRSNTNPELRLAREYDLDTLLPDRSVTGRRAVATYISAVKKSDKDVVGLTAAHLTDNPAPPQDYSPDVDAVVESLGDDADDFGPPEGYAANHNYSWYLDNDEHMQEFVRVAEAMPDLDAGIYTEWSHDGDLQGFMVFRQADDGLQVSELTPASEMLPPNGSGVRGKALARHYAEVITKATNKLRRDIAESGLDL